MIACVGLDTIENVRVERGLAKGPWMQEEGVFSESEIRSC